MKRQRTHADWALLPRWHLLERPNIQLRADIELASSFVKFLLDALALLLMLLPVFVLTILVAIPNALTIPTLLEGITLLFAHRTHLCRCSTFRDGSGIFIIPFRRSVERHGAKLFSRRRCTILFR